jgi:hypothetical protein
VGINRARALVAVAVVATAAGAPACNKWRSHRGKRSEPIVDQDLRFSLKPPSDDWRLLPRAEIRGITPDAVAGAQQVKTGVYGAIIVEQIPGVKLDAAAAQIRGNLKLDDIKQTPTETVTVAGKQSRRWMTTGSLNGVPIRFQHTLFVHQDHLYQLVAWGPLASTEADGSSFRPFVEAFSLLDGTVKTPQAAPAADRTGIGWRVHGNTYENAPYGLRVTAPAGWRVVVRPELAQMNESALVGLQRSAPDCYFVLIVERAPGKIGAGIAQKVLQDTAASYGSRVGRKTVTATVDGQKSVVQVHPGPAGVAGEVMHTVLLADGLAVQILGWYAGKEDAAGREATLTAFPSLHLLAPDERAKLAAAMGPTADPLSLVGKTFAYRGDVYRNFKRHFLLKRTGAWELDVEASARGDAEELTLPVENPEAGLAGELRVMPNGVRDNATLHEQQVVKRFGRALGTPSKVELGGKPALETRASVRTMPPLTHVLTTAVSGRWGFVLRLYGIPENVDKAAAAIDELRAALRFDDPSLADAGDVDGTFVDWRMGYRMRPPGSGWQRKDVTPTTVAAITSVQSWTKLGYEVVMSVMPAPDGQAEAIEAQAERQGDRFLSDGYSRRSGHVAGQRAKILAGSSGLIEKRAVMLRRRGVFYLLLASWPRFGAGQFERDLDSGIAFLD